MLIWIIEGIPWYDQPILLIALPIVGLIELIIYGIYKYLEKKKLRER